MIKNSLIIPIYKNESGIEALIAELILLDEEVEDLEVVFVVDGSPDNSAKELDSLLLKKNLKSQVLILSRNFGSIAAVRAGMSEARGKNFAVMAADLQEPLELIKVFFRELEKDSTDIIYGERNSRSDPFFSRISSVLFWYLYKRFIVPEMPYGGVDVFGCNKEFRNQLLAMQESHSSLIALIFWLGFRRSSEKYDRKKRIHGKSAWTFRKKIEYLKDSIFSFSKTPIVLVTWSGITGVFVALTMGSSVLYGWITNSISVPGYTATMLIVVFFGGLNLFGLGIIGTYAWRTYENTKKRPASVIMSKKEY